MVAANRVIVCCDSRLVCGMVVPHRVLGIEVACGDYPINASGEDVQVASC